MTVLELPSRWLNIVQQILTEYLPDKEVIAYGSRVNGTSHDGSDLDLAVRNPLNLFQSVANLGNVREAFSESNLPILVDIIDWAHI